LFTWVPLPLWRGSSCPSARLTDPVVQPTVFDPLARPPIGHERLLPFSAVPRPAAVFEQALELGLLVGIGPAIGEDPQRRAIPGGPLQIDRGLPGHLLPEPAELPVEDGVDVLRRLGHEDGISVRTGDHLRGHPPRPEAVFAAGPEEVARHSPRADERQEAADGQGRLPASAGTGLALNKDT